MKVQIEYFGMQGSGENVTKAKRDAGTKIEAALSGSYTPEILEWRGTAILLYREPSGWCSRIIADKDGVRSGRVWGTSYGTFEECQRAALAHLADCGYRPEDGDEVPPFLTDRAAIGEYRRKVKFWQRCLKAQAAGITDSQQIHAYGCEMFCDPVILARVDGAIVS